MSVAGFNCHNLDVVDYLRSGALVLGFLATAFADKKGESSIWLTADALAGGAFGVGLYLFPNIMIDYQLDVKSDALLELSVRVVGALLLGMSITFYYSSKDRAVSAAWLLHRVLSGLAVINLMLYTNNEKTIKFKDQYVSFGMLACALWTLGNIIHLFRANSFGSVRRDGLRRDSVSTNILFDALLMITWCLTSLAVPKLTVDCAATFGITVNAAHMHVLQLCCTLLICTRIYSLLALNFGEADDRKAFFRGNLWFWVLSEAFGILMTWNKLKVFDAQFWIYSAFDIALIFNSMCVVGCFRWVPCSFCSGLVNWCKGK